MSEFGVVILKPDAVQEGIDNNMINEFVANGAEVVIKKSFQFLPKHIPRVLLPVEFLEKRPLMVYGYIQNYLVGSSTVAVLKFPGVENATERIVKLKGKIDTGGIRAKYFPYNAEDLRRVEELEYPNAISDIQLGLVKCRNRIHSPETEVETLEMLNIVLQPYEMEYLRELGLNLTWEQLAETNQINEEKFEFKLK